MYENNEQLKKISSSILGKNFNSLKLIGGINNSTYLISNDKYKYVFKKINAEISHNFDRYLAEKQFFNLTTAIKCECTPKLIHSYDEERVLILEYINPDINQSHLIVNDKNIQECINFIHEINNNRNLGKELIEQKAADSFKDLIGHIENINSRMLKFNIQHLPDNYKENANDLLLLLNNKWKQIKSNTFKFIKNYPNKNKIDDSFLIISPSDFGFHNIIISNGKIYFIDFEFSGWDDPAKLYCDFILQPRVRIPKFLHNELKMNLINKNYMNEYQDRLYILYNLLKFKWHTIKYSFLNENKYSSQKYNKLNLLKLDSKEYINEIY